MENFNKDIFFEIFDYYQPYIDKYMDYELTLKNYLVNELNYNGKVSEYIENNDYKVLIKDKKIVKCIRLLANEKYMLKFIFDTINGFGKITTLSYDEFLMMFKNKSIFEKFLIKEELLEDIIPFYLTIYELEIINN